VIPDESFEVIRGRELLTRNAMSDKGGKNFCNVCGAQVFNRNKLYSGVTVVSLGCLDEAAKFVPIVDIFCADMLPWLTFWRESKCYEKGM